MSGLLGVSLIHTSPCRRSVTERTGTDGRHGGSLYLPPLRNDIGIDWKGYEVLCQSVLPKEHCMPGVILQWWSSFVLTQLQRVVFSLCTGLQRKDQLGPAQDPQIHSAGSKVCLKMRWSKIQQFNRNFSWVTSFWGLRFVSFLDKR